MRKIGIEECHKLLLGIAKEFDAICTKHNIPYFMLGGTMLGAIRHKGFIPWDDDMDFGVPREHYDKLLLILEKELPERYKCYTYQNNKAVKTPFAKMTDTTTRINDPRVNLPIEEQIGVNIDIFPLDYCEPDDTRIKKIYLIEKIRQVIFINPPVKNSLKLFIKRILRMLSPVSNTYLTNKSISMVSKLKKGSYIGNIFGRWKEREIIPIDWYGIGVRYKFEDITLCGLKEYDKYLTKLYKDYMQLPPAEKQSAHVNGIYIMNM